METRSRILLHVCCAPCSTASVERLVEEGYAVVLFFSNSNIHPEGEYLKRLAEARKLSEAMRLDLVEDAYDHGAWLEFVRGLENESERGKRCLKCFEFNLRRTAAATARLGLSGFTTTLTVSRHKSSGDIFAVGEELPGFVAFDFKKKDGYARSVRLSHELDLYRQGYCGCEFSLAASTRGKHPEE